uniref:Uncharacterized protein n=1 Tax=Astyanax mexicanus TaxID=7994 RepID=A0A3B1KC57_ASTMX
TVGFPWSAPVLSQLLGAGRGAGEIREKGPAHAQSRGRCSTARAPPVTPPYRPRSVEPSPDPPRRRPSDPTAETAGPPDDERGRARRAPRLPDEGQNDGARGASTPPVAARAQPHFAPWPTDPALRANPYLEVTDLTCRLPLPTLFQHARDLHPLPRIFKGQRELTGRRQVPRRFPGRGPLSRGEPIPGSPALHKEKRTLPVAPLASPGSFAYPHWPPRGAYLRHSGFGI